MSDELGDIMDRCGRESIAEYLRSEIELNNWYLGKGPAPEWMTRPLTVPFTYTAFKYKEKE